jgi:hypothetical protein
MLDVFKARLKAKTKAAGVNLSQKRIDAFADRLHKKNPDTKEETDHDKLIDELDELVAFADVAKEDDRVRTLEAKTKTQSSKSTDDDDDDQDDDPKSNDQGKRDRTPKWARELMEDLKTLKQEKAQTSIRGKIAEKLKDKVPEKFYSKRAIPEKDEDLEAFVADVEKDWTDLKQENNNLGLAGTSSPAGSTGSTGKAGEVDADMVAFAKKQNEKASSTKN